MDPDDLLNIIAGLNLNNPPERAAAIALLQGAIRAEDWDADNFEVQSLAYLKRVEWRSEQLLRDNVNTMTTMIKEVSGGNAPAGVVAAMFKFWESGMNMTSDLISPWKQFTNSLEVGP